MRGCCSAITAKQNEQRSCLAAVASFWALVPERVLGCAGREGDDDLECWVAVATEAYARSLIAEMPLFKKDGQYVPQTDTVLTDIANRIWNAVKSLLKPFSGDTQQLVQPLPPFSTNFRNTSWPEGAGSMAAGPEILLDTCFCLQHSLEDSR